MPATSLSIAREIAYDAFIQVMDQKKKPEDVTEELYRIHHKALKRLDRNFVKEILFGGLRWYSKIYWILQNTSNRNLNDTSPEIRAALVLGTYQIFYMDRVPDRAAVNESVQYIRNKGQPNACPFVNGILRQIARRAEYFTKPDKTDLPAEYLALQYAHPRWVVDRWLRSFKFAKLEQMLSANNQPPPNTIRINTLKVSPNDKHDFQQNLLKKERTHSEKRPLRCALRLREYPCLDEGSFFSQGYFTIQDEAAQLISFLVDPRENEYIIDSCAGPGGKLSHLFELSEGKARLCAVDVNEKRLQKAKETMDRLGFGSGNVKWVNSDFMEWKSEQRADKILLDAPCTGLGVLRRHPEGKWHKEEKFLAIISETQRKLLKHALANLKVGGRLVYSVCSFEPEETVNHLRWLKTTLGNEIEIVSPIQFLPDFYKKYVTRDNLLLIYAGNQDDTDGFGAFVVIPKKEMGDL